VARNGRANKGAKRLEFFSRFALGLSGNWKFWDWKRTGGSSPIGAGEEAALPVSWLPKNPNQGICDVINNHFSTLVRFRTWRLFLFSSGLLSAKSRLPSGDPFKMDQQMRNAIKMNCVRF